MVATIGRPAPAIGGTALDGSHFDLATLRGKPVILNFWASWCGPCRDEFPLFEQAERDHAAQGLTVVGVLFQDSAGNAQTFVKRFGADWTTISDPGGALATTYKVGFPPQTYFIDSTGVVRKIQYGELTPEDLDTLLGAILQ